MKSAGEFKHGHGRAESRLVALARLTKYYSEGKMWDLVSYKMPAFCFSCSSVFEAARPGMTQSYPARCECCSITFDQAGRYTLPDLWLTGPNCESIAVYVNEPVHEKDKIKVQKDALIISRLREVGVLVYVIKSEEIDSMTDATLKAWLLGVYHASVDEYDQVYQGEKEYKCLQQIAKNN